MSTNSDPHAVHWSAIEEATELLREGESEEAIQELRAAIDQDPRNPYAHYFLGIAFFERGEFESSCRAYQEALKLAPSYLGALVGLGHALRMMGRYEDAIAAGENALKLAGPDSEDADAHYLLGLIYFSRGESRRAIEHLEAFVKSNPELEAKYEADAMLETLRGNAKPLEPT